MKRTPMGAGLIHRNIDIKIVQVNFFALFLSIQNLGKLHCLRLKANSRSGWKQNRTDHKGGDFWKNSLRLNEERGVENDKICFNLHLY